MRKKLYVGNLPFTATEDSLIDSFSAFGTVESANLIMDRDTNRSKGFGFVEMSSSEEADKAIAELNGKEMNGRALTVSEARPQVPRSQDFGGARQREGEYGGRSWANRGY